MDKKEILNSPPAKFLIPMYKIYLPPQDILFTSTKWIVSRANKPYVYAGNMVGNSKRYPQTLESTDTLQSLNLI